MIDWDKEPASDAGLLKPTIEKIDEQRADDEPVEDEPARPEEEAEAI